MCTRTGFFRRPKQKFVCDNLRKTGGVGFFRRDTRTNARLYCNVLKAIIIPRRQKKKKNTLFRRTKQALKYKLETTQIQFFVKGCNIFVAAT